MKKLILAGLVALTAGAASADIIQIRNLATTTVYLDTPGDKSCGGFTNEIHTSIAPVGVVTLKLDCGNLYLNPVSITSPDRNHIVTSNVTGKHAVYQFDIHGGIFETRHADRLFTDDVNKTDWDKAAFESNNQWSIGTIKSPQEIRDTLLKIVKQVELDATFVIDGVVHTRDEAIKYFTNLGIDVKNLTEEAINNMPDINIKVTIG